MKRQTSSNAPESDVDELVQHEAEVAAVLDADGVPEANPEGDEWDDLDAEDSEDPLMDSEYVVDIFKYLKQTEVRVLKCFVLLPKLIPHPQLTTLSDPEYMASQKELA